MAPPAIRQQMTEMFQAVVGNYRGLAGGMLFFNILVQNVMATIFVVISGVIVGIIPTFAISSNGFGLGVLYRAGVRGVRLLEGGAKDIAVWGIGDTGASYCGLLRPVAGRDGGPEGAGEGIHPSQRCHIEHSFRRYFAIVFPLLMIAAGIETALILALP